MQLGFGIKFADFGSSAGLRKIDAVFTDYLKNLGVVYDKCDSAGLLEVAPFIDDFLAELFCVTEQAFAARRAAQDFRLIYECKRRFVMRIAVKNYPADSLIAYNFDRISEQLRHILDNSITEMRLSESVLLWLDNPERYKDELDIAARYAAFMVAKGSKASLFNLPQKIYPQYLVTDDKINALGQDFRLGFEYRDPLLNGDKPLNEANYCIYCHNQGKDSCSKGMTPSSAEIPTLSGCPLKQKISEMNCVKAQGFNLAALAIITLDNPLVAATGHRICNDCMKACIYQKQDAVDIPLVESNILESVLNLPYGVEIYLLLTRWNPFNPRALPPQPTGHNVLVAGLGPAGIAASYYMLQKGHNVVAIDGLKINDLPFDYSLPIKSWSEHKELLAERIPQGFGGVAEYGITTRWDKNNLTLLRLILQRHTNFRMYGAVALGSSITNEQAFAMGFDHIVICKGAGRPKVLRGRGFLGKGALTASDFLMTLQSGGAFLHDSATSLTLRMPIAVIGGGLTAFDAATEALNYYPIQVEKFLRQYEKNSARVIHSFTKEDRVIAEEFLSHARRFRQCSNKQEIRQLLQELGGVTVYYRGKLQDSPAYRLNHEEIIHALASGVKFVENATPEQVHTDQFGYTQAVQFASFTADTKTVIMAIGTEKAETPADPRISAFGDCAIADSASSVVRAIASVKDSIANNEITFAERTAASLDLEKLDNQLTSKIVRINRLSYNILEFIIQSPLAAENFNPGQFFRLQNYSDTSSKIIEPIALTGAYVTGDCISLIILQNGHSSKLCDNLKAGDKVALMGPAGVPTEMHKGINVVLIGGGLGNVTLMSIGKALRANKCFVTYIAGYKSAIDRFYADKIEAAANCVIWCCEEISLIPHRPEDICVKGTVIDGIKALKVKAEEVICAGSASMMQAVQEAKALFGSNPRITVSVNSRMQCMMKGICGQCLQRKLDGNYIFTCCMQDQNAQDIDFKNLQQRLSQNSLQEKIW